MTKYRILMADGNLQFQTAVRDCLAAQEQVAQVEAVADGQAAIDALRAGHYDALITELIMPRVDGFELLERLSNGLVENPPAVMVVSAMRHEDMVRQACANGKKVKGIRRGYQGLLEEDIIDMQRESVSDIVDKGGTILFTARCSEFRTEDGQRKGAEICKKHGIDGLVVIGGDGSFAGAQKLAGFGVNTVGVPGTIDLDIACTEYTIGFDTAVNTAMQAIDKVRDTSTSHERCSIIEVMGRNAGYIALWCGIANGAEDILIPEQYDYDEQKIINNIINNRKRGKKHHIIINAEGIGHSTSMARRIEAATGVETRATILGYMQRGGSPTCRDRVYATMMGAMAVDLLCEGKSNRVVGFSHGEFKDFDINEALGMNKGVSDYMIKVAKDMSK